MKISKDDLIGYSILGIVAISLIIYSLNFDIVINSNYIIKKDFNKLANYIETRNCSGYKEFSGEGWINFCDDLWNNIKNISDENNDSISISSLEAKSISHDFSSEIAYIKATVLFSSPKEQIPPTNIFLKLKKDRERWRILSKNN